MYFRHSIQLVAFLALAIAFDAARAADETDPIGLNFLRPLNDNRLYLNHIERLRRESESLSKFPQLKSVIPQIMAVELSKVGDHRRAIEVFDGVPSAAPDVTLPLDDFEPVDAISEILELASVHQVIMINESHHIAMHRALLIRLLDGLYRRGFRYFASEALDADPELAIRRFPALNSGYQLQEPIHADLLRIAIQTGFKVVPYEFDSQEGFAGDLIASQNAREAGQAKNIQTRILASNPQAKIIVHAGYSHISKKAVTWTSDGAQGEVRFMASAFQALTGINPLCIDQTLMTERGDQRSEYPAYRIASNSHLHGRQPTVFRHRRTRELLKPLTDAPTEIACDLLIFHPRSRYVNGRPTWLSMGGLRKPWAVTLSVLPAPGCSHLLQAFHLHERGSKCIPIDQVEVTCETPKPELWLPCGVFEVRTINDVGEVVCTCTVISH